MILEQLQIIKKFGSSKESDVSMEDIQKKEKELGVYLPTALKEFYLTFHRDDPIFSSVLYFLPLDELKVIERGRCGKTYRILAFIDHTKSKIIPNSRYIGFLTGDDMEDEPQLLKCDTQCTDYIEWFDYTQFSSWLLSKVAWQQIFASPNVIDAEGRISTEKTLSSSKQEKYSVIHKYQNETYMITKSGNLLMMKYADDAAHIAVPSQKVEQIEQYMQEFGLTYTWKKRNGVDVPRPSTRPPVKKRPLKSIQTAIDLALDFLGLPKGGLTEATVVEAEQRLGFTFPLPLREAYLQIPTELLHHPDRLFPPKELAWDKQNKLFFFAGDQGEPEYAIEDSSPIVFLKNPLSGDWGEWTLLDSFLAGEILWNTMCNEERGVTLTEFPECSKYALGPKGKLGKYLKAVVPSVTKGGRRQLYTTPSHDILVLRDDDMGSTYLASVGNEPLERLEQEAKIELSWL